MLQWSDRADAPQKVQAIRKCSYETTYALTKLFIQLRIHIAHGTSHLNVANNRPPLKHEPYQEEEVEDTEDDVNKKASRNRERKPHGIEVKVVSKHMDHGHMRESLRRLVDLHLYPSKRIWATFRKTWEDDFQAVH